MATTPFLKDFDSLLQAILTDYQNLDPQPDTSKGSMTFIAAACQASALYGLYRYQDYIAQQIFPDSSDSQNLDHWGQIYGLSRQTVTNSDGSVGLETDPDFLTRILQTIRKPAAGGNHYDWSHWCMFYNSGSRIVTTVNKDVFGNGYYFIDAVVYTPSPGVVNMIVSPNDRTLSAAALAELHVLVTSNIELNRPVTAYNYTIYDPELVPVDVWLKVDAASYTQILADTIKVDITNYINSLQPGAVLYMAKLTSIAINDGANGADLLEPNIDFSPSVYQEAVSGDVVIESM